VIKEILYKWFGIDAPRCPTCEVLQLQLEIVQRERDQILHQMLWADKSKVPEIPQTPEELRPVLPQYIPWRVRQQMMEAEDRKKAQLLAAKTKEMAESKPTSPEIEKLEEELGIKGA
jgi:hypothetical protein